MHNPTILVLTVLTGSLNPPYTALFGLPSNYAYARLVKITRGETSGDQCRGGAEAGGKRSWEGEPLK